jgi:glutamine cyclotransferase
MGPVGVIFRAPDDVFLEGIAVVGDDIIALTWRNRLVYRIPLGGGSNITEYPYPLDGWGLAYNKWNHELWASNGTEFLTLLDSNHFRPLQSCSVHLSFDGVSGFPVRYLNEIEFLSSNLLIANIFISPISPNFPNYLVIIDIRDCSVTYILPVFGVYSGNARDPNSVLNGILSLGDEIILTGKYFKKIHKIRINWENSEIQNTAELRKFNITKFINSQILFK